MLKTNDDTTTAAAGAIETPTVEGIRHIIDEFERRWPSSERVVAVELPPSTEEELLHACGQLFPEKSPAAFPRTLFDLPLYTNLEVPFRAYALRMADGSKVMHYPGRRSVRCLAPPDAAA